MAKKKQVVSPQAPITPTPKTSKTVTPTIKEEGPFYLIFKYQAMIIGFLAFIFYINTFSFEYALDDRALIVQNKYVNEGFAGIPKIMTSDAFLSYLEQQNSGTQLEGGRYRPLSIVTFAIEQQLLGLPVEEDVDLNKGIKGIYKSPQQEAKIASDMHIRHLVNVLLYALASILLLYTLRKLFFAEQPLIAFLAALLFVIHPIHTEVVANVKSRDEILSVIFICCTFLYSFKHFEDKKTSTLIKAMACFLLAMLSKEFAASTLVLLPLAYYINKKLSIGQSIAKIAPLLIPFALYMAMRISSLDNGLIRTDPDIMNNPYLLATPIQKFTSEVVVLLRYLKLMFFPHPLSSDYSYKHLPYSNLSDPLFYISAIIHAGIVGATIVLIKKRHILSFALVFYLINLLLISNFFFNLGATMGERLMFHSSVGFSIIIAWLVYQGLSKIQSDEQQKWKLAAVLIIVLVPLAGFKTITRNTAWKSDKNLFLTDVQTVPRSIMANNNAASACIEMGDSEKDSLKARDWYLKGITYANNTLQLDSLYVNGYLNKGVCSYKVGLADSAMVYWGKVRILYPNHPSLAYFYNIIANYYFMQGNAYGKNNNNEAAVVSFKKGIEATPMAPDMWFNYGYANMLTGRFPEALRAYEMALKFEPGNKKTLYNIELCKAAMAQLPPRK